MSYILEALKKSEQQREIGRVPGISSVHESTVRTVSKNWLWVFVVVLLLNAGLLVLLLWPESEADRLSSSGGPPAPAVVEHEPAAAVVNQQPPAGVPPAEVPRKVVRAPHADPPMPEPLASGLAAEPLVVEPAVTSVPLPQQPPVVSAPGPAVRTEPPVVPAPTPALRTESLALPVWPQIPRHLSQQLNGSLRLDVHVFSEQPAERFVFVNMQKYREGERLQEGPQLDEITPDGVILSLGGQRFRVQAQ
jgi:general secretion pathway protein B